MVKKLILVCSICLSWLNIGAAQDVYQSTDDDGVPSFTDVPELDAKKLKLKPMNVLPGTEPIDFELRLNSTPEPSVKYRAVEITSPENNSTIHINANNLLIKVNVVPAVRSHLGHTLQIIFDGEVLVENSTSYTLDEVDRGSHNISARIVDKDQKVIERSESVTVHIRKPSV